MKAEKATRILSGILICPLTVGQRALIIHEGRMIRTTTVVSIGSVSPGRICFETRNTRYFLLAPTAPQSAPPVPAVASAA